MSTAIEFNHISKQYRLGLVSTRTLSHDLDRWFQTTVLRREDPYLKIGDTNDRASKGNSEYVWALRDIDFKVEQGDVVGIIGKNGAGKSTLLKLLSKVTAPTTGTIRARGRIASLLEVGTGFHSEMTGRENIYLNGAILGMTKQEITRKLDEIVDFSGCERYIDTPVKRYSSGMTVRLGFAVAAHLDPEILVVDEVLAVGDAEFQKKAIGKMNNISRGEGRTVLFVSHNMASIRALCRTGILLENGRIKSMGEVNAITDQYLELNSHCEQIDNSNLFFDDIEHALGNSEVQIKSFSFRPMHGKFITLKSGIDIQLCFKNNIKNALVDACFSFSTKDDIELFQQPCIVSPECDSQEGYYTIHLQIPPNIFNTGVYQMHLWFGQARTRKVWGDLVHTFEVHDYIDPVLGYAVQEVGLIRPELNKTISFSTRYED